MDVMHHFDVETIGVLSSITVFSMSAVSIGKQMLAKVQIPFQIAIPLSLGSVVGGYIGQWMLSAIVSGVQAQGLVTVVQNGLLAVLILCVYLYMKHKANIRGLQLSGVPVSLAAGCFLGICSSFLGIGRRPDQRSPYHLPILCQHENGHCLLSVTILFAQISKLVTVALSTGFLVYDLSVAPVMVVGAIAGGFLGASLSKRFSEAGVERAFNCVQLLVLAIALFNIARNLIGG